MSAVVEIWVSELSKLKEKVRAKKPLLFMSKGKGVVAVEEEKEAEQKESQAVHKEITMSEATVCMLMDRFAPW